MAKFCYSVTIHPSADGGVKAPGDKGSSSGAKCNRLLELRCDLTVTIFHYTGIIRRMNGNELRLALGRNLKLYRHHRKFSQAELAEKANISLTFLSDIERGNKWPYPDTLTNLAKALGVSVSTLFWLETDISEGSKTDIRQFSHDIRESVDNALDTVFREYQLG
jgi:transcriptional regulator with XRE-family HTH domain